ncbi:myo-inositol 2-dehydrogenase [Gibbsiella quercinecans]|uniref:Inositol 2-dehydrogenase n=1 Tax=Gibbsiella quercinecans TaxID=929813 RepID=A0A250B5F1_9GAMM|nr:inositol 2-dehydrogenase [Gibbsiella quercinecans]ATA21306.1 inositol 2-dehydrogenase [Gibbsiella quercinecans]RLM07422.1 inositol 2-dehydrogenase [Gibbsiella quercinecans]RLM13477.1 inositol 2-dehydrogenase [Gibbsiella quercinecans]TCT88544.1 myo-inositol 2-dehydrogenase [Gibbsiella quercinecans]
MKKLRCGIIGLGRVGKMHIENMLKIPELDIIAVSDFFVDSIGGWLDMLNIGVRYKDYRELLARTDIEAVFIFTSTDTHEQIITAAAEMGKHIFCEKPLSMSTEEEGALAVLRTVKQAGVKLQLAFNRRFDPQFRELYDMVRAGKIGQPQIVKISSRDPDLLPHDLIKKIGGLIFDFTMHDFDMARFMMGYNINEVFVKGATLIDPTLQNIGDVDTLAIILTFENGGYALIDNSRRAVYGYDQRVEVFGSDGMAYADNINNSSIKYFNSESCQTSNPLPTFHSRYREAYLAEINCFIRSVMDNVPIACTGEDAFIAQRVAIAAQRSLQSGCPVKVNSDVLLP